LESILDKPSHKKYAKEIYKNFDKIILGSSISVDEAVDSGCPMYKTEIQPVTIETEIFKPLNKKSELRKELNIKGEKILLFIGRINFAEKGIGYLLEAVKIAKEKLPDLNLVIIGGGGEEERMLKKIKELQLENFTQHVGRKPLFELVKYINASDVFMMPSVWLETFGQVTIEAMSCGVPVIGFDCGATPEININNKTGFNVPTKNVEAMADAIIKTFSDDERRQQMGVNARQRVIDNYSYEAMIKQYIELVEKLKK
jgi:glycosyltransferase involved in cell wall biosynthesis